MRSKTKLGILKALNEAKTVSQIARHMDIFLSSASTSIKALEEDGLIKCLDPDQPNFRFYQITKKGKKAIKAVEDFSKKLKMV